MFICACAARHVCFISIHCAFVLINVSYWKILSSFFILFNILCCPYVLFRHRFIINNGSFRVVRSKFEMYATCRRFLCIVFLLKSVVWVSFLLGFEQGTTVRVAVFYIQNRCYPAAMAGKLIEYVLFVIRFESHAYLMKHSHI